MFIVDLSFFCYELLTNQLLVHCIFVFVYLYLWHEMGCKESSLVTKHFRSNVQLLSSADCPAPHSLFRTFFVSLYIFFFFFCWRRNVIQYVFLFNTFCREWLLSIQMLASGVGSHWTLPIVKRQKHQPASLPSIHPSSPMALWPFYPPGWQGGGWRVAPERSLESLVERAV